MFDVVDALFARAEETPARAAIIAGDIVVSYGEFVRQVKRYAASFIVHASRPSVLIALPQGADAYAAMFGALLCGGFYAPVNIAAPLSKLRNMVAQLQPTIIVAGLGLYRQLVDGRNDVIHIDPAQLPSSLFESQASFHDLAYVIFTSGSTGVPKGVMIPRTALNHYAQWIQTTVDLSNDLMSQNSNIGFDLSVLEIYGALCSGATLIPLVNRLDRLRPASMIQRERLTVWISVPSCISLMLRAQEATSDYLSSLRLFLFCGEPLLPEHLDVIFDSCPHAIVYNTYGPTEATVSVTSIRLTAENYRAECTATAVALGAAIADMKIDLVHGENPDEGEIVITGPQVALGYFHDEHRTRQAFRPDKQSYFTGDWAERRNGRLFFQQRIDQQVKIHGYRIELDEIEAAIRDLGWPTCCVFKWNDVLVAVVERTPIPRDVSKIRHALMSSLEDYKVPPYVAEIEEMPRNENEKLDRMAVVKWFDEIGQLGA
jgi:D-alanine--poly(phosphoribitol) ligase subunit 1